MKKLNRSLPFIFLVVGVVGLAVFSSMRAEPLSVDRTELAPLVETAAVQPHDGGFCISVDGEVIPYREVNYASQVRGRILKKAERARAGNFVRQGELLYEIDPSDYELELRRLQETVKQASSAIEEADVEKANVAQLITLADQQLELQRAETARFDNLRQRNAASSSQYEAAKRAELQSQNSLQTLRNQLALVEARRIRLVQEKQAASTSLQQAQLNLSRTQVRSPLDGVVIQDSAEQDDYVQIGTPLVMLEDTSSVEVRFSLRLDQLRWLWSSQDLSLEDVALSTQQRYQLPPLPVRIRVAIDGFTFTWPARLDRYDGAGINAATRTAPIIAIVESPQDVQLPDAIRGADPLQLPAPPTLLRGTFVTVDIPVGASMSLLSIPTGALRPGQRVWAFDSGRLAVHEVRLAHAGRDHVLLLAQEGGLAAGDPVITSPLPLTVDGMALRHVDDTGRTAPAEP